METEEDFLQRVERLFESIGFILTEKRRYVLRALFGSDVPLSGENIQKIVEKNYKEKISIGTIYKTLNTLSDYHVLQVLILAPHATRCYTIKGLRSQNYLVCNKCGMITIFFDKIMESKIKQMLDKDNFTLMSHRVVLYGVCKDCR